MTGTRTGTAQFLLREATAVEHDDTAVTITVRAVLARRGPDAAGFLTGESLADQGIETTMPNLPDLDVPELEEREVRLRIAAGGPDAVRVTLGPPGRPASTGTELGIVTAPDAGAPRDLSVDGSADAVEIGNGSLRVVVDRRPFAVTVTETAGGRVLLRTAGRLRQVAGLPVAPAALVGDGQVVLHLELGTDEDITGFGEQFGRLVKNGQRLRLRVEDALGTAAGMAYKPAPVWHSTAGYLGLLNTGATVTADVEHTLAGVLALTVDAPELDLWLVAGRTPKARLRRYTDLTGRAAAPPPWAFGFWLGRCRYHSAAEMLDIGHGLRAREIPCDVLHADPDWLVVDRLNCDFIWNTDRFGDRKRFVDDLAGLGIRLSLWELPYLDPRSPRYAEAEAAGHLVRDADGAVASIAGTPVPDGRPRALLDFTDPDARRWWQDQHAAFLDDGVAVFKTDFGEGLPEHTRPADGSDPVHAHNLYPLRYNAAVSDAIAERTGRAPLVWGRSGWAGSHRYPAQWSGDAESTVAGMRATLRGGLSHALSIPGPWGHDVGGFFGPELTPGLYLRWLQFGALSPLMRAHGLRPREPWAFGEQVAALARDWIRLRYSLLPYLWQVAHECATRGLPLMRPLAMEFPDDEAAAVRDDAFMLGADLLVVPVFDDGTDDVVRRFYLPAGDWTDLLTGRRLRGPGMREERVGLDRTPVLVRDGARLPRVEVGPEVRGVDDLLAADWTVHTFGARTGDTTFVGFDGRPFTLHADGSTSGDGAPRLTVAGPPCGPHTHADREDRHR